MKKDPTANIDVHRDARPAPPDISYLQSKWAIGTQKYTAKTGKVTDDGKLNRSSMDGVTKSQWRNPTDVISFEPPQSDNGPI